MSHSLTMLRSIESRMEIIMKDGRAYTARPAASKAFDRSLTSIGRRLNAVAKMNGFEDYADFYSALVMKEILEGDA
jgi:uncharacterized MAPEG superfamily protein